jgi:hypothetical protein
MNGGGGGHRQKCDTRRRGLSERSIVPRCSQHLTRRVFAESEGVKLLTFAVWLAKDRRATKPAFAEAV